ncbi:MAG: 3-phosphoglycerate dehydrogenase, partial [Oscillospiraceae bacterium]|nr:3-phosphoglycerate dehydrogenase [Oscillospiraceae bacterium]
MYKIQTLNKISDCVYTELPAPGYQIAADEAAPDAVLVRSASMHETPVPESLLAVARAGAGVNNIPVAEYTKRGIAVFNTPGANANAVAELVVAGMLLSARKVVEGIGWAQGLKGQTGVAKLVEKGKGQFGGPELRGKTLGVIGLGAIGALVANAASDGLGMRVIGVDPYLSVRHAWSLSRAVTSAESVAALLPQCDWVTVHVPLSDQTRD